MTKEQLIQQVALRMDEVTPDAELNVTVDGSDNNPLYTLIDGLVNDGLVELFSVAPYWRLPQIRFEDVIIVAIREGDRKIIKLKVPADFLRVAEIDYPGVFQRPITEIVSEQSPEGRRQHNRFLMGKLAKPVGVMSHGVWEADEDCREIDCYSLPSSHDGTGTAVLASYIAKPTSVADVPDVLLPALEWLIAARTFGARGDANHAAICQQNAQSLLV